MAKAPDRTQRRHVREKATIDHLVQDVYKPKPIDKKHRKHNPNHVQRLAGRGSSPQGMGSRQRWPARFLTKTSFT